jgi:putative Mn2+ efflux pump MntP
MIRESRKECEEVDASFSLKTMTVLSLATSIDALAVGVSFAFLQVNILQAVSVIGITTLCLSIAGVFLGYGFGSVFKSKAEMTGGIILIIIGIKILIEHILN